METVWFAIIAVMLAVYVVLDGFDLGVGVLHLFVAKNDAERRTVLASIGPIWDGNEVWLLASGGVLFFAFPRVYAAGFSGFYLPLMMSLWLLVLRGIAIEFRSMVVADLWRSFWDGVFFLSSLLMAVVLGAALGNVIRGVPLGPDGYFSGPLFTNFMPWPDQGVLDWYTVLVGVFALAALTLHGALFLVYKTEGELNARARGAARVLWWVVVLVGVLATIATHSIRPELYEQLIGRPWTWILALGVVAGAVLMRVFLTKGLELKAFLGSVLFLASMLAATAAGVFPILLRSTVDAANNLTTENAAAGALSLRVGLIWWLLAIVLAIGYFSYLFHSFRGKVQSGAEGYGH
ncbi:MAG: cytochrome d ubiquinol oxidase subunit II [Fimbriimonadaceae bacterium]|nr:cytochrome d ubiquinol oxidase subunit II [Fimbriimonadaceae bacterium]